MKLFLRSIIVIYFKNWTEINLIDFYIFLVSTLLLRITLTKRITEIYVHNKTLQTSADMRIIFVRGTEKIWIIVNYEKIFTVKSILVISLIFLSPQFVSESIFTEYLLLAQCFHLLNVFSVIVVGDFLRLFPQWRGKASLSKSDNELKE